MEVHWQTLFSGPKDIKDIFSVLKDSASEVSESNATVKHQVHFICRPVLFYFVFGLYFCNWAARPYWAQKSDL